MSIPRIPVDHTDMPSDFKRLEFPILQWVSLNNNSQQVNRRSSRVKSRKSTFITRPVACSRMVQPRNVFVFFFKMDKPKILCILKHHSCLWYAISNSKILPGQLVLYSFKTDYQCYAVLFWMLLIVIVITLYNTFFFFLVFSIMSQYYVVEQLKNKVNCFIENLCYWIIG